MNTSLRAIQTGFVLSIFLSSILFFSGFCINSSTNTVVAQRERLISFPAYIEISYDVGPLNEDLAIDKSISVPINITYTTGIPDSLSIIKPWTLRNIIIFGSMIVPMQKIHLEIEEKPDWADIHLTNEDVYVDIPFQGDPVDPVTTTLVISPREEAPAVPQSITIKATSQQIGRVQDQERSVSVSFTPSFIPTVDISVERSIREAGPHETVSFQIIVENMGNKKARVWADIIGQYPEWTPVITPPRVDVLPGEQKTFDFSVYTPYYFGWHNEREAFDLEFTYKIFPVRADAPEGGPDIISLTVSNYGFSTPGFEIILLVGAIICVAYLTKRRMKEK